MAHRDQPENAEKMGYSRREILAGTAALSMTGMLGARVDADGNQGKELPMPTTILGRTGMRVSRMTRLCPPESPRARCFA